MKIENICRFKKVLIDICIHPEQNFLSKLNFFRFMGRFQKMQKKSFLTPLGLVRQYDSPNPYCSPSIIIQGNFHLSKHPRDRFDRFFCAPLKISRFCTTATGCK